MIINNNKNKNGILLGTNIFGVLRYTNNVFTYYSLGGSRKFSSTSFRYQDTNCDCCSNNKDSLTTNEKRKLKSYGEEFASNNKVPVLDQETKDKILNEKAVDIAAAYKDNPEGLEDRKKEAYIAFQDLTSLFAEYFIDKNDAAIEKLNNENMSAGKLPVCMKVLNEHMDTNASDKDKVLSSRLTGEDQDMGFLSKEAYVTYKDTMLKHNSAKQLIDNNSRSIENKGNPDSIDKDLYKNELTVTYPSSQEVPVIDPSNQDEPAIDPSNQDEPVIDSSDEDKANESESENTAKRKKSLEDEELNPDSVKKPKRDDSDSGEGGTNGGLGGVVGGSAGTNNANIEVGSTVTNNLVIENGSVETNDTGTERGYMWFFENILIRFFLGLPSGFEMVLDVTNNINMFS